MFDFLRKKTETAGKAIIVLLLCMLTKPVSAQDYILDSIVLAGYGINDISEIYSDPSGLIYINDPQGGLYRFTGNGFNPVYYRDENGLTEIKYLKCFLRDENGFFYGLNANGEAVSFSENGNLRLVDGLGEYSFGKILADYTGRIWFLGSRSWVLENGGVREVPQFSVQEIESMECHSNDSVLYLLGSGTLLIFDLKNETSLPVPVDEKWRSLAGDFIALSGDTILFVPSGATGQDEEAMLFYTRNGLVENFSFDENPGPGKVFLGERRGNYLISGTKGLYRFSASDLPYTEEIYPQLPAMHKLLVDRYDNIWCSSGTALYRLTERRFYRYSLPVPAYLEPWHFSMRGLIDERGVVWVAGRKGRIASFDPFNHKEFSSEFPDPFPYRVRNFRGETAYLAAQSGREPFDSVLWQTEPPRVRDIAVSGTGEVYVAGVKNLYYYNPNDDYYIGTYHAEKGEELLRVIPLQPDSIIVFTSGRVMMLDRYDNIQWENSNFAGLFSDPGFLRYMNGNEILAHVKLGSMLYIRMYNMIAGINLDSGTCQEIAGLRSLPEDGGYFKGNLAAGTGNRIWYCFRDTLRSVIGTTKDRQIPLPNSGDNTPAAYEEVFPLGDEVWINTGRRMLLAEPLRDTISEIHSERLSSVFCLIAGEGDYLWRINTKTVQRINIRERTLISYPVNPGSNLSEVKALRLGNLIVATNGREVVRFDERRFMKNPLVPAVIAGIELNREPASLQELIRDSLLVLDYDAERLTFRLATGDPGMAASASYMYQMEGFDPDWMLTGRSGEVSYTSLPAGNYTFRFATQNRDGRWSEPSAIRIKILPPWWETRLAFIGYFVALLLIITTYIRYRERKLKEEKRKLEIAVKERTAEIEKQKEELAAQRDLISEQKKDLTDSINYASRIQSALIPGMEVINKLVPENFILYRPRDIVSGDFYWIDEKDDRVVLVGADCTGHGVPGSLLSMLGITFLEEIVMREGITAPAAILDRLRDRIIRALKQSGKETVMKDGMDIVVISISNKGETMRFAGAKNPVYLIRKGELSEIKGDSFPVGFSDRMLPFREHEVDLKQGDLIYVFSDGFVDQFGGIGEKKFKYKRFRQLLLSIKDYPMLEQKTRIEKAFDDWKGPIEQIDDVLVIGIRV